MLSKSGDVTVRPARVFSDNLAGHVQWPQLELMKYSFAMFEDGADHLRARFIRG
jgi:hypothetical protein